MPSRPGEVPPRPRFPRDCPNCGKAQLTGSKRHCPVETCSRCPWRACIFCNTVYDRFGHSGIVDQPHQRRDRGIK